MKKSLLFCLWLAIVVQQMHGMDVKKDGGLRNTSSSFQSRLGKVKSKDNVKQSPSYLNKGLGYAKSLFGHVANNKKTALAIGIGLAIIGASRYRNVPLWAKFSGGALLLGGGASLANKGWPRKSVKELNANKVVDNINPSLLLLSQSLSHNNSETLEAGQPSSQYNFGTVEGWVRFWYDKTGNSSPRQDFLSWLIDKFDDVSLVTAIIKRFDTEGMLALLGGDPQELQRLSELGKVIRIESGAVIPPQYPPNRLSSQLGVSPMKQVQDKMISLTIQANSDFITAQDHQDKQEVLKQLGNKLEVAAAMFNTLVSIYAMDKYKDKLVGSFFYFNSDNRLMPIPDSNLQSFFSTIFPDNNVEMQKDVIKVLIDHAIAPMVDAAVKQEGLLSEYERENYTAALQKLKDQYAK